MPAHALRLRGRRRRRQRSWQVRRLPMGHLGLHHCGNVRLRRPQAHPAAHWQAGDCGHGARDAGNELGQGQLSPAHTLRLRGRRRSQQRSWQVRRLPMGLSGLHHRGNVRLRRPQAHPEAHWQAGDCGQVLETLAMSWGGVSHCLHMHCGSADAGAAGSAPGKSGGCRWDHLGLHHRGNVHLRRPQAIPGSALAGRRLRPRR